MSGTNTSPTGDQESVTPGGAVLRSILRGLARFRTDLSAGSFYRLVVLAYFVLAAQILGLAGYDLHKAAAIIEASSLSDLLLTIPALSLLPTASYLIVSFGFFYALSKIGIEELSETVRRSTGFVALALLLTLPLTAVVVAAALLPAILAGTFLVCLLAIVLEPVASRLVIKIRKEFGLVDGISKPEIDYALNMSYPKAIADSARTITDLAERRDDLGNLDSALLTATTYGGQRRRLGIWLLGLTLVTITGVVIARPWMPPRAVVVSTISLRGCESYQERFDDPSTPDHTVVTGYLLGETNSRTTILTLDRGCIFSVDSDNLIETIICTTPPSLTNRTLLDLLLEGNDGVQRCSVVAKDLRERHER